MPLDDINEIIKNNFKENFEVSIKLADNSAILEDKSELNFLDPKIELKINNVDHEGELHQNFNDEINIYESDPGCLNQACEELRKGNLEISAHLCRKEFERICHEFEELLQIGKKEELQTIIDLIKNEELVLPEEKLVEKIEELQKASKPEKDKLDILKNVVTKELGLKKKIQCLIKKCENYKKILLNPSSHYDIQREFHQKECQESTQLIECLKELKIKLCDFKKSENIKEIQKICKDM